MKLLEKIILLTRFGRDNKRYPLDIEATLQEHSSYWTEQSKFFKDKQHHESVLHIIEQIEKLRQAYTQEVSKLDQHTSNLLRTETVDILRRDYEKFDTSKPTLATMESRIDKLDPEFVAILEHEIGYYSDWRWAGVELNPSNGYLTRAFLACDPLYLYTGQVENKDIVKQHFNRFFREKRLMWYDSLEHLPKQQLGLAVSVNVYEFWPMDPIKTEIKKVYDLLAPGGHFIFTYNNCEEMSSLDLCTNSYRSYNTKELMSRMVEMFGFEILKANDYVFGAHSLMVVKKPGELTSQKLTSPLVKIETPKVYVAGCAPGDQNYQPENHKK